MQQQRQSPPELLRGGVLCIGLKHFPFLFCRRSPFAPQQTHRARRKFITPRGREEFLGQSPQIGLASDRPKVI